RAFSARRLKKRMGDHPIGALLMLRSLIDATTRVFMIAVATWLAMRWLEIPERLDRILVTAILVIVWFQVGLWMSAAVRQLIEARRGREIAEAEGAASVNILRFVSLLIVWTVALLMLLANLGVEIMPLVAGLGIGGVAIALAVQNVLGDLFASLSIALDKPFRVGDFIITGQEMGSVERIGIKSTHLRSLSGELIVMPNGELLKSRLRNYTNMWERRMTFQVSIPYETERARVAEVPGIIEQAIRAQPKTRFDRAHFASLGASSLVYEAVYFVLDAGYNLSMDIQQAINLALIDEFARRGIAFAYPTVKQWRAELPQPPAPPPAERASLT
ncbi:MAG: mechanosensitive ion channel family protein, partial [Steroidobacteraceae bacterium]